MEINYKEDALENIAIEVSANVPDAVEEPSYYIEGSKLIITKGK